MSAEFNLPQFLKDVDRHTLHVLRDEGLYRHLRFKRAGTMCMHFDIITWPGYLCYTGDMGAFVFTRLPDMLQFFRRADDRRYRIDFRYWAEKCEAINKGDGIKKFSHEKFAATVKRVVLDWVREQGRDVASKTERRELWDAVVSDVLQVDGDASGHAQCQAAYDFSHVVNAGHVFRFHDSWEYNFDAYTQRFLWCCHALAWGISMYDEAREAVQEPA